MSELHKVTFLESELVGSGRITSVMELLYLHHFSRKIIVLHFFFFLMLSAEPPAFEVLPSLKRLKQRVIAASRGQYDAVFMSGRYGY